MRTRAPLIVDRWGRPALAARTYQGATAQLYQHNPRSDTAPGLTTAFYYDQDRIQSTTAWKQQLSAARFLFANVPIVRGALLEQAAMSFPLQPQYVGRDKEWGKKAEEWLWNWYEVSNAMGSPFGGLSQSKIRLIATKIDGDLGVRFKPTASGYPQLEYIRSHRIGSRQTDGTIPGGQSYSGLRIINGCILNDRGRVIAYRILGDSQTEDEDVSTRDLMMCFWPEYSDQHRGTSHLCASIASFTDIARLREYEMRAQLIASSIGLIEKNETGMPDQAAAALYQPTTQTTQTGSGLQTETMESGMIRYFRAASGSGLEAFRADRPTADAQAFEDKIVTQALYGLQWDPNFALAIKEPGGAWARTVIQKVRRVLRENQEWEKAWKRREDGWAISRAVKLGMLPPPPSGDWYSWDYQPTQAQITADSGNDENAKREAYKLGLANKRELAAERGRWWEEEREQREIEVRDLLDRAKKLSADYGITVEAALDLLEQRTPNGAPVAGQPETDAKEEDDGR